MNSMSVAETRSLNDTATDAGGERLSIAIVARRVPVPIFTGINLVVHHLAVRLAGHHRVKMFVTDDDASKADAFPVSVSACGKSGYGDAGAVATTVESYASYLARYYGVPVSRTEWLKREVSAFGADVVLGFGYDLAAYLEPLVHRWPVVFDPIDSEILYLWRLLSSGKFQLATAKHLLVSLALARRVLSKCDALISVSDEDSHNLQRVTGSREVHTIPNGVDCDFFAPRSSPPIIAGRVIFSGSMSWLPNSQALEWFLEHCWARIRSARPDATLQVVGKGMTAAQQAAFQRYPNVTAVGFVDDIRDHVLAAELSIAPMISGSGIKNKVLEAWAMSRPVVATPLAARGLNAKSGQHLLVAEAPAAFAEAVLAIMNDATLRDRIGSAGRALAQAEYSWESMTQRADVLLRKAVRARANT
jgi:polysaccharide biosynthesis protein PslH